MTYNYIIYIKYNYIITHITINITNYAILKRCILLKKSKFYNTKTRKLESYHYCSLLVFDF